MKKKQIILAASVLLVAFAACVYLYNEHPLTLKLLNGSSRVLSPPMRTTIKMDGQIQTAAKCFAMKTLFDGEPTDSLVIWLPNASSFYGREILIINRNEKLVGMPNSSNIQYELLLNRYLLQAESGSLNAPFTSAKWDKQDPQLEIAENKIEFILPELDARADVSSKRIEVVLH